MIALSDVQASLSLFAEAIAGEPVAFEIVESMADTWPWSEPSDRQVRPTALRLPPELASRRWYRVLVLHDLLTAGAPVPADLQKAGPLLSEVYTLVEDVRIGAVIKRVFPGAIAELNDVGSAALAALRPAQAVDNAGLALQVLRRHGLGASLVEITGVVDQISPAAVARLCELADEVLRADSTPGDSLEVAQRIVAMLTASEAHSPRRNELIGEASPDDDEQGLPSDGTTGVALDAGTPDQFSMSDGVAGGQLLGDSDDQPITEAGDENDENDDKVRNGLEVPRSAPARTEAIARRTYVYDEWDYHEQRFRRAWCRVVEEELVGDDHTFIQDVRGRHQALRAQIRRNLVRLRPQDLVRVYRSDDGDELDLDAAIEAMADRRSGAPVDDRLHIRRDRAARDVSTAFLVDLSASTSSPASPPEPDSEPLPDIDPMDDPLSYGPIWQTPPAAEPVRRVIDVAKDAVALMGDALHELGDQYAIYGFSGTGRENVEFKIGKDFSDRVSASSWANIAAMKPLRYTRMGPAVRHATAKLASQPSRTRILIVVSDGYPQDADYGRDRHDRDYGVHDTGRALAEASALGIETFCVTIDPAGQDYLRAMCADDRYLIIDDVESLPEQLASLYLERLGR